MMSSHEMLNDRKVDVPGDGLKAETAPTSDDNLTVKRAIIGLTTEGMRRVLLSEEVFRGVATADEAVLAMYWRARDSDEYQDRVATLQKS